MEKIIKKNMIELMVGSDTNVGRLAGSIKYARESNPDKLIVLRYVGAGAGGQAVKAVIIANRMLEHRRERAVIFPLFGDSAEHGITIMLFNLLFQDF